MVAALVVPATMRAQIVVNVVDRESRAPLPYSTIFVTASGTRDTLAKFADGYGQALFVGLSRGQYHVRARELGFAPSDTIVTLSDTTVHLPLVFRLRAIPHRIAPVVVRGEAGCRHPGLPDSSAGADAAALAIITSQLHENAERVRLFTAAYPFYYQRETHRIERASPTATPKTVLIDTTTYDSRLHPAYQKGRVVRLIRVRKEMTRFFLLPNLVDLADPAFQRLHCFSYAGRDSGADGVTIRFDVEPLMTLGDPDAVAQFYLDPERYLVRRAKFQLTHPDRVSPMLKGETVETHYREIAPLVAVADSVVSTTTIADTLSGPEPRAIIEESRLIRVWDVNGAAVDTSVHGVVADADTDAVSDTVAAPAVPATATDIRGRLVDALGQAVPHAHLEILGSQIEAEADDSGGFRLRAVPPGDQTLFIRRIGYRPTMATLPASLPARRFAASRVTVQLPASSVVMLDPVVVIAQREAAAYHRIGFDTRRQKLRGFFLDAEQIAAMRARLLREVMARAPGFRYIRDAGADNPDPVLDFGAIPNGSISVEGDAACSPTAEATGGHPSCSVCLNYFVNGRFQTFIADGRLASLNKFTQLESRYPPDSIAAIEVYAPLTAPAGLTSEGAPDCAAIVLWTKQYLGI